MANKVPGDGQSGIINPEIDFCRLEIYRRLRSESMQTNLQDLVAASGFGG
jgi:hypothetical protein